MNSNEMKQRLKDDIKLLVVFMIFISLLLIYSHYTQENEKYLSKPNQETRTIERGQVENFC